MSFTSRFSCFLLTTLTLMWGCTVHEGQVHSHHETKSSVAMMNEGPDTRVSLRLDHTAQEAHQAVMRDHLKAVHEIIAALVEDDHERAQDLAQTRLGFAIHREAMRKQNPEHFPPAYHDLAMAHHRAAEDLAKVIPSKNLNRILPHLERTLNVCVQCHESYKQ